MIDIHSRIMASKDASTLAIEGFPPLHYDHSPSNISSLIQAISKSSTGVTYSTNLTELTPTSSTSHSYAPPEQVSKAVFYPRSTEDTSIILKECHARRVAVTAYSGGTSLPGALTNSRGGVCVHFGKMDRVLGVNEGDLDVRVQPGIGWVELNE